MEKKKTIICVLGRSAAGKTSLVRGLCKQHGYRQVRSYTTRKPRANEKDPESTDHYFVDKAEFHRIMKEETPVAFTKINGNEYCATEEELLRSDIYVIDPEGLADLKHRAKDRFIIRAVYICADRDEAARRTADRCEDPDLQRKRWEAEDAQFTAYEKSQEYDAIVENDGTIEEGVQALADTIRNIVLAKG